MIEPTWQSDCGQVQLYLGDCREVLKHLPPIGACVTDPPYGINYKHGGGGKGKHSRRNTDSIIGDDVLFDPSHLLNYECILWGANHYANKLPHGRWLVWNKLDWMPTFDDFSDVEIAWHSKRGADRIYSLLWKGICQQKEQDKNKYHPNQKPINLLSWCLSFVPDANTILDPYMGSGTTGIACLRTGRKFIGIEISEKYFNIAKKRIKRELSQLKLPL